MKQSKESEETKPPYENIHMPTNTSLGFYIGVLSFVFGFAMIWYMFWLAIICSVGMIACVIVRLYQTDTEFEVTAKEIQEIESRTQTA